MENLPDALLKHITCMQFESHLVKHPKDRFSHDEAQLSSNEPPHDKPTKFVCLS